MSRSDKARPKMTGRDVALIGVMIAILETVKSALAFLPNVELVSLLFILYTLSFGWRVLFVVPGFILLEGMLYGFGLWWVMYLYAWPLLVLVTWVFRRRESVWFWSVLSGMFGLCFGALCALPYYAAGGAAAGFSWWVAGIPYDIVHGVANFVLCLALFAPLHKALGRFSGGNPERGRYAK